MLLLWPNVPKLGQLPQPLSQYSRALPDPQSCTCKTFFQCGVWQGGFVCSLGLSTPASSAENTQQIGCIPDILENKGPFAFMGSKGLVTLSSLLKGPAKKPKLETTRTRLIFSSSISLLLYLWASYLVKKGWMPPFDWFLRMHLVSFHFCGVN